MNISLQIKVTFGDIVILAFLTSDAKADSPLNMELRTTLLLPELSWQKSSTWRVSVKQDAAALDARVGLWRTALAKEVAEWHHVAMDLIGRVLVLANVFCSLRCRLLA